MLYPIKVADVELSQPLHDLDGLTGYWRVQALVRLHGIPIGYVNVPITNDRCLASALAHTILNDHGDKLIQTLLTNRLAQGSLQGELTLKDLVAVPSVLDTFWQQQAHYPLVTVAVCTRDRPDDMKLCLSALSKLDYPNLEILVVDNAPTTDSTRNLVEGNYPQVRYVCEPRPGLDWARNRAILEARGEIIAYTDDDVVVDPLWVKALAWVFVENPQVMAVTGLVVPYELETKAQMVFENNGGFGRGFERKWYQVHAGCAMPWHLLVQPGLFGTGANMAYRRQLFNQIGGFDPALDVGTATNGGGDLEMFYRTLKEGQVLVYEPAAIVRHRHRRDYAVLKKQITNNGSVYAYLVCSALRYPDERWTLVKLGIKWIQIWHLRNLVNTLLGVGKLPLDLVLAEAYGCWVGLFTYQKACRDVQKIIQQFGAQEMDLSARSLALSPCKPNPAVAVRTVELSAPIQPIEDIAAYPNVRIYVTWQGSAITYLDINNQYATLSTSRLCAAIVGNLALKLFCLDRPPSSSMQWFLAMADLYDCWLPTPPPQLASPRLPDTVPVSIVVATYDRPHDLPNCLNHLFALRSSRPVEIVIVDNHPSSGITPPIVAKFPNVVLVNEPRQGLAYARNAGILASTGDIIVATDDDVSPPPDWLEKLLAPFVRPDVMAVTGNTLPIQLDTFAQQLFEEWGDGGLGRGFEGFEGSPHWFERTAIHPVPAWKLGATANAAFRATVFHHPDIGLMYEPLGPGMPSGVGEDTYLLYKIMKAGFSVVYEPSAFVWHRHRRDLPALRRQLYNYSKGIVSYQLTTLLNDRDQRALKMLFRDLPGWHIQRIRQRFQKQSHHPIPLSLVEIWGHLAGPWSLWRSHQRVRAEGKSGIYIPVAERPTHQSTSP